MSKQELKALLLEMQKTEFEVPEGVDAKALAEDMVKHIGDTDPVLRDDLILTCLWILIEYDDITVEQQREILEELLSDRHLFANVGENEGDKVFDRTFSILIIGALVSKFEDLDYGDVLDRVLDYGHKEVDLRGYVADKGWAHSTAHMSDTLGHLAKHKLATADSLKRILALIHEKMSGNELAYVFGEDERMARATETVFLSGKLSQEEIIDYIKSFKNVEGEYIDVCVCNHNTKSYMRSLYFRLRKGDYNPEIIQVIDQVLREELTVKW